MTSPCLDAAIAYLARGWSSIPLCPYNHEGVGLAHAKTCDSPGKAPLWAWKEYQHRRPTEKELKLFWNRCPTSNVGIVLGPVSGLIGLDIDGPTGETILHDLSHDHLPPTLEFATPRLSGGRRLLYAIPENITIPNAPLSLHNQGDELRILSFGRQTVMPPSTHHTGKAYLWNTGHDPHNQPAAAMPQWLIDLITDRANPKPSQAENAPTEPFIPKGQRDTTLTRLAGAMRRQGAIEPDIVAALNTTNQRCMPPLSPQDILKIARSVCRYPPHIHQPMPKPIIPTNQTHAPITPPTIINLSTITPKPVSWLMPAWLPQGKLTILDGDPGLGKSTILLDLAARVTTNGVMPNNTQGLIGNVGILSAEDEADDTIVPRLIAAGASLDKIFLIEEINRQPPTIPDHLPELEKIITEKNIILLILDPLTAYLRCDLRSDQEVRRALHPFKKTAARTQCTVTFLRHLNKGTGTKAIYRGGGSIAIVGSARAGMLVAPDPENQHHRILAQTKANLQELQPSLRYTLQWSEQLKACRVVWIPGPCSLMADDLLQPQELPQDKTDKQHAIELLQTLLATGQKKATDCFAIAKINHIGEQTLKKAKLILGVINIQMHSTEGTFTHVEWALPNTTTHTVSPVPENDANP